MGEHKKLMPMNIGDILDYTIKIYKTNFLKLFLSSAIFFIPLMVLYVIADSQGLFSSFRHYYYNYSYRNDYMRYYLNTNMNYSVSNKYSSLIILLIFVFMIIFSLIYVPAIIKLTSEILMGRNIKATEAYKYSCKKVGSYFLTKLLAQIIMWLIGIGLFIILMISFAIVSAIGRVFVGFFLDSWGLALILGIIFYILALTVFWVMVFFPYGFNLFVSAAFVINNVKYTSAIKEGFKGLWFKCWRYLIGSFAISIIISIPVTIFYLIGYIAYDITAITSLMSIISMLGFALVQPIFFIMISMFFYDYKIRRQGFGIEVEFDRLNDNDFKEV